MRAPALLAFYRAVLCCAALCRGVVCQGIAVDGRSADHSGPAGQHGRHLSRWAAPHPPPHVAAAVAAAAMSLVFHSAHPFIPTLRADVRMFEASSGGRLAGGCSVATMPLLPHSMQAKSDGAALSAGARRPLCFLPPHPPAPIPTPPPPLLPLRQVEGQLWYGGGCDLTPCYIFDEDVREFHAFWKQLCDRHDSQVGGACVYV